MPSTNLQPANWIDGDEVTTLQPTRYPVTYQLSLDDGVTWSAGKANPAHLVATVAPFTKTTGHGYLERSDPLNGCQGVEWYDQDYQAGIYAELRAYEYLSYDIVRHPGNCTQNDTIWEHQVLERIFQDRAACIADGQTFTGVV